MLKYFDLKLNTEVICDDSPYGLSAIFCLKKRVVAYASRSLTEIEQKYSKIERETSSLSFGKTFYNND